LLTLNANVVGRLAPSPTGLLHLGHARTFLLAWWSARAVGGRVLLRIEDLDGDRSKPEFMTQAVRDLAWLGLDWDGAPIVQSTGLPALKAAIERLLEAGLAYPCTCTRADLQSALSAPQLGAVEPRYPGTCRGRYPSVAAARAASGRDPGVRFRVEPGIVEFVDRVHGPQAVDVAAQVGDFLIARRDGTPAYQLAVVMDDAAQGVTEIVRGDDLLASTARQWLLQSALALPHPSWAHVPLVVDESGRRLAKRERDLGLAELREGGVDPQRIVAWAAASAGFEVGERVAAWDVIPRFDLSALRRDSVVLRRSEILAWGS
jgi:glutamyl-tRNA synthetase